MKLWTLLVFIQIGGVLCRAQEPAMAGTWQLLQQKVEYAANGSARSLGSVETGIQSLNFNGTGQFSTSSDSGRWLFSNDYMVTVLPGEVNEVAVAVTGDTFVFAGWTSEDQGGGNTITQNQLSIAVKEPASPFTAPELEGDWVLLQQEIEFIDLDAGGVVERTLREVSQNRTDLSLNSGGVFQAEIISDTNDPGDVGALINGTWLVSGGELQATVGPEVISRTHFSAGGDLVLYAEEGSQIVGNETSYSSRQDLWIRKAEALTAGDVVGCWGLAGTVLDVEVNSGSGDRELFELGFEEGVMELKADGTGLIRENDGETEAEIGQLTPLTWVLLDDELVVSSSEGQFRFVVSQEKDFALMQRYVVDGGSGMESFNFFGLAKLPEVAGFGGEPVDITVTDTVGGKLVALSMPAVFGISYQVETSDELESWDAIGPVSPAAIQGVVVSNLPVLEEPKAYFRWRIVAPSP